MSVRKKLSLTLIILVSAAAVAGGGLFLADRLLRIDYDGTERAPLNSGLTITRDTMGIPQIDAGSLQDLYFALGYLHAKDRLNVMEYHRAIAIGLPSRLLPKEVLPLIRLTRMIGFTKTAEDIRSALSDQELLYLRKYCSGINHIRRGQKIRGMLKREWHPEDVLALLAMREWANSFLNNTELLLNIAEGRKLPGIFSGKYIHTYSDEESGYLKTLRRVKQLISSYIGTFNRGWSANIDKSLTLTGSSSALFSYENSLMTYPDWYPVNINVGGERINSLTCAGLPFLFLFKTKDTLFTHFNLNADTQDFYIFQKEYRKELSMYKSSRGLKEFKSVRVPVFTRNESLSFHINWHTEMGPVIADIFQDSFQPDDISLSVKSVLPGPGYVRLLLNAPFSKGSRELSRLISRNDSSPKCFMILNEDRCYSALSGLILNNRKTKSVFRTGGTSPDRGFTRISRFSRAGRRITLTGSGMPDRYLAPVQLTDRCITENLRHERLTGILPDKKIYDENMFTSVTEDKKSAAAEKITPMFTKILSSNPLTSSRLTKIYFSDWDYRITKNNSAPTLFYNILNLFIRETLSPHFGPDTEYNMKSCSLLYEDFYKACEKNLNSYFDNPETDQIETREKKFDTAFLMAIRKMSRDYGPEMENWKWGRINSGRFTVPSLKNRFFTSLFPVQTSSFPGGADTVLKTGLCFSVMPESVTSLYGYFDDSNRKMTMKYAMSSTILSDFYYGRTGEAGMFDLNKTDIIHRHILEKSVNNR